MQNQLTAQDHLEAAQKIADSIYKLETGEQHAEAIAKYEEHLKQAEILKEGINMLNVQQAELNQKLKDIIAQKGLIAYTDRDDDQFINIETYGHNQLTGESVIVKKIPATLEAVRDFFK